MKARIAFIILTALFVAIPAQAQPAQAPANPWAVEIAVGWDNSISGALFTSGIGIIDGQPP
jgi:hypothetical protein